MKDSSSSFKKGWPNSVETLKLMMKKTRKTPKKIKACTWLMDKNRANKSKSWKKNYKTLRSTSRDMSFCVTDMGSGKRKRINSKNKSRKLTKISVTSSIVNWLKMKTPKQNPLLTKTKSKKINSKQSMQKIFHKKADSRNPHKWKVSKFKSAWSA